MDKMRVMDNGVMDYEGVLIGDGQWGEPHVPPMILTILY